MAPRKPNYVYDRDATLATVLRTFFAESDYSPKDLASALEITPEMVARWEAGEMTSGLVTRYLGAFEGFTGIDLDRLMVVQAKREICKEHPGLQVSFDTLLKRSEIVDHVRPFAKTAGSPMLGELLGIAPKTLSVWCGEGAIKQLPEIPNLKLLLKGIFEGKLQEGTRDDVLYRKLHHQFLGGLHPVPLADITTFHAALQAFYSYQRGMNDVEFERASGVHRSVIARLKKYEPGTTNTMTETVTAILRFLVKQRHPDALTSFSENAGTDVEEEPDPQPLSAEQAEAAPAPQPRPERSATKPAPAARLPHAANTSFAAIADWLSQGSSVFRKLAETPVAPEPQVHKTNGVGFNDAVSGAKTVGEDRDGIRFCITKDSFHSWPGRDLTKAEQDDTIELLQEFRRRLIIIAGLDSKLRDSLLTRIAHEFDEIWHALSAAKVEFPAAALGLMELERDAFKQERTRKGES